MLKGNHLIAGQWISSNTKFENTPISGDPDVFASGGISEVALAAEAAELAFETYSQTKAGDRAAFLRAIADEIDLRGEDVTAIGVRETGLPEARLNGERGRTCGQLRLFADHIEKDNWFDFRHDEAMPDRSPTPRTDLKLMQRPIGPIAVFGASNFPLAFSTAGGDTAAALAAGCSVVVKGHPAHPGVSDIVAQAVLAAIQSCKDIPLGVFNLVQGDGIEMSKACVTHPLIQAVGFTGSHAVGRSLFDLANARPQPIPFFGELGSVNPVFVLQGAAENRLEQIAKGWAASLVMGVGQFCTNPGILIIDEKSSEEFVTIAIKTLQAVGPQLMLTESIANAYRAGRDTLTKLAEPTLKSNCSDRCNSPDVQLVSADKFLANPTWSHEVFGPLGIVVTTKSRDRMLEFARRLEGQLTCTLQLEKTDIEDAKILMPVLERKAGRLLTNGFPTGVEVSSAMMHGGPYPASTNVSATSVGTLAIRRFLRPVCYQNMPNELLPLL